MANQTIDINLIPDGILPVAKVSQYDVKRTIIFRLYQGSSSYPIPSGSTVQVRGLKGDNCIFIYDQNDTLLDNTHIVAYDGSTITLNTSLQMTAAAGDCLTQFRILKNTQEIATLNFIMQVQLDPAGNGDISQSELPAIITMATEQMHRAEAAAEAAAADADDAHDDALAAHADAQTASDAKDNAEAARDRAETAADAAEAWSAHPPYIGANGNWWIYNTTSQTFVDSGIDASITVQIADITMLAPTETPYVTNTGTNTDPIFHLFIPRGKGIASCAKTSTTGLVDTYTITYSDGYTDTFTVTNGRGIESITKTATAGLVDTYTITYNDNTTSTYTVTNGADGQGAVSSVNNVQPIGGNVTLNLDDINDVDIVNPVDGDRLVYDSTAQMWKNEGQIEITVQKPSVSVGTYTYNGNAQGPTISGLDTSHTTVTNATATNAGSYTLTIALNNTNTMKWNDNTTAPLTYSYTIDKAASNLSLDSNSVTLDSSHLTASVTATYSGDGVLSAASSDTSVATVGISSNTITISNVNQMGGTATITVNVAASTNYLADSATISVNAEFITIYGFHIDGTESDPASMVSYQVQYNGTNVENYNYTPAAVDLSTGAMNSGSWNLTDDFFIPRSCMLKYDGTVDYYLNENDETQKADGTASDVANTSYGGNAMMEWGRDGKRIYMKIVPDATPTNGATIYIADGKADNDFTDWPFYDANGVEIDHFYTPKYNGSNISSKLRSISGQTPCNSATGANEVTYATANNVNNAVEWYTEVIADRQFINILLIMIGRSTNTQAVFGQGYTTGGSSASSLATTGTLNGKGQWYGTSTNNDKTKGVKIFGMEHWYGNIWRRTAGYLNVSGVIKYKLTYSQVDGTTQTGYDATGSGYKTLSNGTPDGTFGGYISVEIFTEDGIFPKTASGSETTYYTDGLWFANNQTDYAFVGGVCLDGSHCGALCVYLDSLFSRANWGIGAALSCKPLAS